MSISYECELSVQLGINMYSVIHCNLSSFCIFVHSSVLCITCAFILCVFMFWSFAYYLSAALSVCHCHCQCLSVCFNAYACMIFVLNLNLFKFYIAFLILGGVHSKVNERTRTALI